MTPKRFGELLARPALLSGQNATELEELIARFPWCGPLRKLRYEKAVLDEDDESVALWRNRAALFLRPGDRTVFEDQLRARNPARADQHFGFLEGHDAAVAEEPVSETKEQTPPPANPHTHPDDEIVVIASSIDTVDWYLHRHGLIMDYGRPKPAPKESFDSYRAWKDRRAKTSWSDLLRLADEKPKRKKSRKPSSKSISIEPEVASETLADLLAAQGHTEKAIRMYEQLVLRYPNKKSTFAVRIEALQQQLV